MNDLKKYNNQEIVKMIEDGKVTVADIVDSGICPTCFDKENNHILYGDNTDKMFIKM